MRYCPLLLLILGCESAVPQLKHVRSITVNYGSRDGQRPGYADNYRQVEIADAQDVRSLVEAFQVRRTEHNWLKLAFPAMIEFHLADDSSVQCWFVDAARVECKEHQLYLRDRAFYDLVNKLVSKKEGRPIDVLTNER
jgi:hypothetical protein